MKRLIVNADDFGLTPGVNDGILQAHLQGIVTATTLMADAPAFEHAAGLARRTPTLDVGVHLVLWPGNEALPQRLPSFLARAMSSSVEEIEKDFSRQVEKVIAGGIAPSHLDTHKHVHLLPRVMKAVVRVAKRFGVQWVRRPLFARQASGHGLRVADHFTGYRLTGRMELPGLLAALGGLRPGLTELMCHPGICDLELRRAPTRLKEQRQRELEALTDPEARRLLDREQVELTSFRAAAENCANQLLMQEV